MKMSMYDALEHLDEQWPKGGMVSCPLHPDKSPSLQLNQDWWYCHSCSATGDAYRYIAEVTGRSLPSVLKQYTRTDGQDGTKKIKDRVGPNAMAARIKARLADYNRVIFDRLHEVFQSYDDDMLVEEILDMHGKVERLKDEIMGVGMWDDQPPMAAIPAIQFLDRTEGAVLTWLDLREHGLQKNGSRQRDWVAPVKGLDTH